MKRTERVRPNPIIRAYRLWLQFNPDASAYNLHI